MKGIPFLPLLKFIKIIVANGGLSRKGISHSLLWFVKTILLEPLRWLEIITGERKVVRHQLRKDPVFILGHYRSGTTFLQRLFMQDKRLGYMSIFQSAAPEIMFLEKTFTRISAPLVRWFGFCNPFHRMPFTWDFPGEEDVGMTALLNENGAQWGMLFPQNAEMYFQKYVLFETASGDEKQQWLQNYSRLVKKISVRNQGKRLVLKSPPNTARIPGLLRLYPGAVFVFIHRHPLDVYASTIRFRKVILDNYVLGACKNMDVHLSIIHNYERMMDRYLACRNFLPANRLIEVAYDDLVADPVAVMERIYKHLSIADFDDCRDALHRFAVQQKNYERLEHKLEPHIEMELRKSWERFLKAWGYGE